MLQCLGNCYGVGLPSTYNTSTCCRETRRGILLILAILAVIDDSDATRSCESHLQQMLGFLSLITASRLRFVIRPLSNSYYHISISKPIDEMANIKTQHKNYKTINRISSISQAIRKQLVVIRDGTGEIDTNAFSAASSLVFLQQLRSFGCLLLAIFPPPTLPMATSHQFVCTVGHPVLLETLWNSLSCYCYGVQLRVFYPCVYLSSVFILISVTSSLTSVAVLSAVGTDIFNSAYLFYFLLYDFSSYLFVIG